MDVQIQQQKEVAQIFSNVGNILKKYTPKELNDELISILNSRGDSDKNEAIEYVIKIVCEKFNISRRMLLRSNARGKVSIAKQITHCLLHFNMNLPMRFISKRVFMSAHHVSVAISVKKYININDKIKPDKEFSDTYNELTEKLNNYIKAKNDER